MSFDFDSIRGFATFDGRLCLICERDSFSTCPCCMNCSQHCVCHYKYSYRTVQRNRQAALKNLWEKRQQRTNAYKARQAYCDEILGHLGGSTRFALENDRSQRGDIIRIRYISDAWGRFVGEPEKFKVVGLLDGAHSYKEYEPYEVIKESIALIPEWKEQLHSDIITAIKAAVGLLRENKLTKEETSYLNDRLDIIYEEYEEDEEYFLYGKEGKTAREDFYDKLDSDSLFYLSRYYDLLGGSIQANRREND